MSDKTEFVEVECTHCKKKFNKTLHRYKEAQKMGYRPFCSKKCKDDFKITSLNLKCSECNKDIVVLRNRYDASDNKRFFCNSSCFATFNNKLRGHKSEEEKDNIALGLKKYYDLKGRSRPVRDVTCLVCGKSFKTRKTNQNCCSRGCHCFYRFGELPYTKDDVINTIINIAKNTAHTPQKRDCKSKLFHTAVKFFGTWNKAMEACGLKPNHSKYQKIRLKSLDGHMSDSISEKIIDDWLFKNNVKHEKSKRYPNSRMDCDFYFVDYDLWVEYFGLSGGDFQEYEETIKIKKEMVKNNNLKFVALVPDDLYGDKKVSYSDKLNKIFGKYINGQVV